MAKTSFDSRSAQRVAVACPVIFGGAPFVGEGSLQNLSRTGCSIACDRTVLAGSYIRLAVLLPDSHQSLFVELGKIRWVRGQAFGVEFMRVPTVASQPIDRTVWKSLADRYETIGQQPT